jgi:hypothetical protein
MNRVRVQINLFLVGLCASYLTLGLANPAGAAQLWWVYAIVSGALAVLNLVLAYEESHR